MWPASEGLRSRWALRLPAALTLGAAGVLLAFGPIPQPASYHAFADRSVLLGVPHAGDVLSNLGFLAAGVWGLCALWPRRRHPALSDGWPGYGLFLAALVLTSAGSAFYHLSPGNTRLLWDRLPIALACAGLLAAVRAESRPGTGGWRAALTLALLSQAAVGWWYVTESAGRGDLRPYVLLQALPLVLVPLWQALYGRPRGERRAFAVAVALYVAAKLAEVGDREVHALLAPLSGHTLKHLLAAAGAAVIVWQLAGRVKPAPTGSLRPAAAPSRRGPAPSAIRAPQLR